MFTVVNKTINALHYDNLQPFIKLTLLRHAKMCPASYGNF